MVDKLSGLGAGGGHPSPVNDVVKSQLQEAEHVLTGDTVPPVGLLVEPSELFLGKAVSVTGLLLFL